MLMGLPPSIRPMLMCGLATLAWAKLRRSPCQPVLLQLRRGLRSRWRRATGRSTPREARRAAPALPEETSGARTPIRILGRLADDGQRRVLLLCVFSRSPCALNAEAPDLLVIRDRKVDRTALYRRCCQQARPTGRRR